MRNGLRIQLAAAVVGVFSLVCLFIASTAMAATANSYAENDSVTYEVCDSRLDWLGKPVKFQIKKNGTSKVSGKIKEGEICSRKTFPLESVSGYQVEATWKGDLLHTFDAPVAGDENKDGGKDISEVEYARLQYDVALEKYELTVCDSDFILGGQVQVRYGGVQSLDIQPNKVIVANQLDGVQSNCIVRKDLSAINVEDKQVYLIYQDKVVGVLDVSQSAAGDRAIIDNRSPQPSQPKPPSAGGDDAQDPQQYCLVDLVESQNADLVNIYARCDLSERFFVRVIDETNSRSIVCESARKIVVADDWRTVCGFSREPFTSNKYKIELYGDVSDMLETSKTIYKRPTFKHNVRGQFDGDFQSKFQNRFDSKKAMYFLTQDDLEYDTKSFGRGHQWTFDFGFVVADQDIEPNFNKTGILVEVFSYAKNIVIYSNWLGTGGSGEVSIEAEYITPLLWGQDQWDMGEYLVPGENLLEVRIYDAYLGKKDKSPKVLKVMVDISPDLDKL